MPACGTVPSLLELSVRYISSHIHLCESLYGVPGFLQEAILEAYQRGATEYNSAVSDCNLEQILRLRCDMEEGGTLCNVSLAFSRVTDISALAAIGGESLLKLDLSYCEGISSRGVAQLAQSCPRLTHLSLCDVRKLTDKGVEALVRYCKDLQVLSLELCMRITDVSVQSVARGCRCLTSLNLGSCRRVSNVGVQVLAEHLGGSLKCLLLSGLPNMTDFDVEDIAKHCFALEHLDLRSCHRLTDGAAQHLARLSRMKERKGCAPMLSLDVGGCARITSRGLGAILEASADLRDVDCRGCIRLTDDFLVSAARHKTLRSLTVRHCSSLTCGGLARLAESDGGRIRVLGSPCAKGAL